MLALQSRASGAEVVEPAQVGVVSWVLPMAKKTRLSNRLQGEDFNDSLRRHVVALLEERGYRAVAPVLTSSYQVYRSPLPPASNWSERHAAFAAGNGTFSLSDGLITATGIAHRVGSVVASVPFAPSPRPYTHHLEYCPHPFDGSCGACIERCPARAIDASGHDKLKCRDYLLVTTKHLVASQPGYIGHYSGCGLCQTKVPCEEGIPHRKRGKGT